MTTRRIRADVRRRPRPDGATLVDGFGPRRHVRRPPPHREDRAPGAFAPAATDNGT
ncbi:MULTISPECIES: hypothetical protein [Streptomyces]|uniref:hypothetical protein n=1 Tax=Streptomyces TaxID=1883 RepID=UPI00161765BD|nr:hypothetical protein [Streptomyces sp. 2132.2]